MEERVMAIQGWYYLHQNGSLIYKRDLGGTAADIRESDFARAMWPFDPADREGAWRILIEASCLGVAPERIKQLAEQWHCTDEDAAVYADRVGCNLFMDGDAWCATDLHFIDLQQSPAGFGPTALDAMAALCRELGYKGSKMWGATFADLLGRKENAQFGAGA
jgi:hypothetical protein